MRISRGALISGISSAIALLLLVGGYLALTGHKTARQHGQQTASTASALRSPFTGVPVSSLRPELIFKIDNVPQARPPTGLAQADIVYILPVEGGLSRIFAVFSSQVPAVVGPVRSAREEDIQLLRQFGRPAFAFSGAQPRLLPVVEHARIVNLYAGVVGGYFRSSNRIAPYNLYAKTHTLLAEAKGASTARDIGFRFGSAPPGGQPTSVYNVAYPSAAFSFRWSAAQHRWLIWMDGRQATHRRWHGTRRAHDRRAVRQGRDVRVPRARQQAAIRQHGRQRERGDTPQRPRLPRGLVAADRRWRHDIHATWRPAHAVRPGSGLGGARLRPRVDSVTITDSDDICRHSLSGPTQQPPLGGRTQWPHSAVLT